MHAENYWDKVANRRKFFLNIAKEKGFDPLISENWYSLKHADVVDQRVDLIFSTNSNLYAGSQVCSAIS